MQLDPKYWADCRLAQNKPTHSYVEYNNKQKQINLRLFPFYE